MLKGSNQLDERVPVEVGKIQVNFCKNPHCQNFGVPASTKKQARGKGAAGRGRDTYSIAGSGRGTPMLHCSFCGQYPTIKSNKAIHEELCRFWRPFESIAVPSCSNLTCANYRIGVDKANARYQLFGRTKAGSVRYRCKECEKTFIGSSSPTIRHRKPHKNAVIFRLLVNKVPFRRICEVEGITMSTLYRKIDFIHRQCILFAAERERHLPTMPLTRLYNSIPV